MPHTLILSDGGVSSLLATAVAGERLVSSEVQPSSVLTYISFRPWTTDSAPFQRAACETQADLYGLSLIPEQSPIHAQEDGDPFHGTIHLLVESGLLARKLGGGEVIWPVTATAAAGGGPDVEALSRTVNQATLVSQLLSLTGTVADQPRRDVRIRTPYADLTDRQVADLVLDMDLPIWTCWFWAAAEQGEGATRPTAIRERDRWTAALRETGWTGDAAQPKARIVTRPIATPSRPRGEAP
jgi:hypothetical protein